MMNNRFDWDEVNSLITILRAKGIFYLMGHVSSMNVLIRSSVSSDWQLAIILS
jgi:hypothetical protein